MSSTQVILITGAPGVGKTTAAQLLAQNLPGVTAYCCGDVFILSVTPLEISDDRRLFLRRNLASFVRNADAHSYDWVIIDCVIPSDEFIYHLMEDSGLPSARFKIISLLADRESHRARLLPKVKEGMANEANFSACYEWMDRIRKLKMAASIDTTRDSEHETMARLMEIVLET